MTTSTMTSKGQVLIPQAYRHAAGLHTKSPVRIKLNKRRIIIDRAPTVDDMFGFLEVKGKPLTKKEMKQVIATAVVAKYEKKLKAAKPHRH